MAVDFIEEIYQIADLAEIVRKIGYRARQHRNVEALNLWKDNTALFEDLAAKLQEADPGLAQEYWDAASLIRKNWGNFQRLGDGIEESLYPVLRRIASMQAEIDVEEGDWRLFSTKSGFLSLQHMGTGLMMHSSVDPMWEAFLMAEDMVKEDQFAYHICGAGLGYLPYQVWLASKKAADIWVYETDPSLLEFARLYGVLDRIAPEKLHLVQRDSMDELMFDYTSNLSKDKKCACFFLPELLEIYQTQYEAELRTLNSDMEYARENRLGWRIDLQKNLQKKQGFDTDLADRFPLKEWVLVAAGPSLGDHLDFLRESQGKRHIVAVNTALRKLAKENIRPDLVVAVDPLEQLAAHLDGVEEFTEGIPLLCESATGWKFVERYRGPVYLCFGGGVTDTYPDHFMEGHDIWTIGSTVTNLAFEAACRFGAEKVYLLGVDLGFPGERNYTDGVAHEAESNVRGDQLVRANDGGMVSSTNTFRMFRHDLEKLIATFPLTEVVNLSEHGAYILGTMTGKWWESLMEWEESDRFCDFAQKLKAEGSLNWGEKYYLLQRALVRTEELGLTDACREAFDGLFEEIYEGFVRELQWNATGGSQHKNLVYVFTDRYGMPLEQEKADYPLKKLLGSIPGSKQVFLVNTAEHLGGSRRAIVSDRGQVYPEELASREEVSVNGRQCAYYQFPANMPDLRFVREFLEFAGNNRPEKIYCVDPYSLIGECCRRLWD